MPALPSRLREALDGYAQALTESGLAANSRRVYRSRVAGYLGWLATTAKPVAALREPHARNEAVAAYQRHLREELGRTSSAVNAVLTAVDHFYRHLGVGDAVVSRELVTPALVPALDDAGLQRLLSALAAGGSADAVRERAVVKLMLYAGLGGAEVSALDIAAVQLAAAGGPQVSVGGRAARIVPLCAELAAELDAWVRVRADWPGAEDSRVLFVSRFGERLGSRSVTDLVQRVGVRAGVAVSPAVLRATLAQSLYAAGASRAAVAALAGRRGADAPSRSAVPPLEEVRTAVGKLPSGRGNG